MTKILSIIVLTVSLTCIYANTMAYNQSDKDRFYSTGVCENCDLTNMRIDVDSKLITPFNLQGSNISESFVSLGNTTGTNFSNVEAISTVFASSLGSYSQTKFNNSFLKNSDFKSCNLMHSDFTGADVTNVDFMDANLYGAIGIDFTKVKSVCNATMPDGSTGECN
jgi:uncharacterized protein YjbI with pentapeptide repeats